MAQKKSQKKVATPAKKTGAKAPAKKTVKKVTKPVAIKKVVKSAPAKKAVTKAPTKKAVAKAPVKKTTLKKGTTPATKKTMAKPMSKKTEQKKVSAPAKKMLTVKKNDTKVSPKKAPVKKTEPKESKKEIPAKQPSLAKQKKEKGSKKSPPTSSKDKSTEDIKRPIHDDIPTFRNDRPTHHIAFSIEDLDAYFKDMANNVQPKLSKKEVVTSVKKKNQPKKNAKGAIKLEAKSKGVATIFDILGFNPVENTSIEKIEAKDVPRKWKKYYNKLVELRSHHSDGVASRSEEVMKRSAKDDAGDLSSNGQHLADAGSASFERDLAYNMITNQTEILAEIDAAIKRIKDGTYGICEVTGKPIPEARLEAIPFARYTVEGQEIHEVQQKRAKAIRRENVFEMEMDVSSSSQKQEEEDPDSGM